MDTKLPIYRATIDNSDDTGMFVVSLVDEPAVEVDFLAFDKQTEHLEFAIQDEEQRKVLGVVMIPNKLIYRRDSNGFEYLIKYEPDTIHQMVEKFFRDVNPNNVDTDHNFELVQGVVLSQAFFKNTEKGINPAGFENMPDDTLFFEYHILNDEIWNGIKEGTWKGFSLAGYFNVEPVEMKKEEPKPSVLDDIEDLIKKINNKLN